MTGVLAVVGTAGLVVEHIQAESRQAADWAQASAFNRAQLLPTTPGRAARTLLDAVTEADPMVCTLMLTPSAGAQLAAAAGTRNCAAAVPALAARVTDARRYPVPDSDAIPTTLSPDGQSATADLCSMSWDGLSGILNGTTRPGPPPGPQLGRLHLDRVLGQGYQITSYTPC